MRIAFACVVLLASLSFVSRAEKSKPEVVSFQSGELTLRGYLYKPAGNGPFPAALYNHGSAPGMLNDQASETLGPLDVSHG